MSRYSVLKGYYEVERSIGSGGFGKVKLGTHLLTREKVAIKIMEKSRLGDDLPRVKTELQALKNLPHQHICKLYQVIETETHYYLILEYCSGGELFDHIVERNRLEEGESRIFFRQIISAIAYLHGKGYVHRDIKPENVLLDRDCNLKLIDFGLCAKPQPGFDSFLYTSCGSPTYAAPELILGQKYLGSEVDIWSLGILLYALLCGMLPFDSENIDSLYKKILSGMYDEPSWLSSESKELIRSMLQVDPRKRITINALLSHPWVMKGFKQPVSKDCDHKVYEKDPDCLNVMAQHYGISTEDMWSKLNTWNYDYDTATYLLLLYKKQRGLSVNLARRPLKAKMGSMFNRVDCSPVVKDHLMNKTYPKIRSPSMTPKRSDIKTTNFILNEQESELNKELDVDMYANELLRDTSYSRLQSPTTPKHCNRTYLILNGKESTPDKEFDIGVQHMVTGDSKSMKEDQENNSPSKRIRKPHKRLWSPGPDETRSPVPSKLRQFQLVDDFPGGVKTSCVPRSSGDEDASSPSNGVGGSGCFGSGTRGRRPSGGGGSDGGAGGDGASSASRGHKLMDGLERSLTRMRHMLTPRRRRQLPHGEAPRPALLSAKELYNVSTTSNDNPEVVLEELRMALLKKGITCRQKKGFRLRGKLTPGTPSPSHKCRLSFELEVCLVAAPESGAPPLVGIRRKRLEGDAWCYRRVVEEVLAMARA